MLLGRWKAQMHHVARLSNESLNHRLLMAETLYLSCRELPPTDGRWQLHTKFGQPRHDIASTSDEDREGLMVKSQLLSIMKPQVQPDFLRA